MFRIGLYLRRLFVLIHQDMSAHYQLCYGLVRPKHHHGNAFIARSGVTMPHGHLQVAVGKFAVSVGLCKDYVIVAVDGFSRLRKAVAVLHNLIPAAAAVGVFGVLQGGKH